MENCFERFVEISICFFLGCLMFRFVSICDLILPVQRTREKDYAKNLAVRLRVFGVNHDGVGAGGHGNDCGQCPR